VSDYPDQESLHTKALQAISTNKRKEEEQYGNRNNARSKWLLDE
jgi:hypothetical protein